MGYVVVVTTHDVVGCAVSGVDDVGAVTHESPKLVYDIAVAFNVAGIGGLENQASRQRHGQQSEKPAVQLGPEGCGSCGRG